jgi:hypothetical protein
VTARNITLWALIGCSIISNATIQMQRQSIEMLHSRIELLEKRVDQLSYDHANEHPKFGMRQ